MSDAWIGVIGGLLGVIVGFTLTLLYDGYKVHQRRGELLEALRGENLAHIGHTNSMQDILKQSVAALREGKVIPGGHVRSPRTIYLASIAELTPVLTEKQRNMLHVAYEIARVGDELLEGQEDTLLKMREIEKAPKFSPREALATQLIELSASYEVAKDLLQKFREGVELDVYQIRSGPIRQR